MPGCRCRAGELPGQQLGGGAVLAAAEAVGDEADHGLAALDGVPAGDVISVESGERSSCVISAPFKGRGPLFLLHCQKLI